MAASVVPLMRPFRDYLVVMLTVLILTTVVDPLIRDAVFGDIAPAGTDPQLRRLFAERVLLVLEALAIIPVLAALGYRGREAYLALGNLRAQTGLRIGRRALSWAVVGPIVAVLLVAATAAFASSMASPTADLWARALPLLPIAWLAAACNAFAEEVLYRAGPLGPLAQGCRAEGRRLDPRGLVRSRPRLRRHPIRGDGVRHGWLARAALRQGDDRHPWALPALGAPLQR